MTTAQELDEELKQEFEEVYGTPIEETEFYQELVKKDKEE